MKLFLYFNRIHVGVGAKKINFHICIVSFRDHTFGKKEIEELVNM